MLDLVQNALHQASFMYERVDGQQSVLRRKESLSRFADDPRCTVMLATLGSGGEGWVLCDIVQSQSLTE